jgi:uncharacterized protein YkwD
MRAPISFPRWVQLAAVCALAVALVAALTPSAGAATHAQRHARHHRRHHARHHRRHHRRRRAGAAVQARALINGCSYADTPVNAAPLVDMRAAVVCLINQQRTMRGLPGLTVSAELNQSAQSWNQWMVSTGNFTHGSNFAGRISAVGYDWQTAGENIATGFATPRQVVDAWMASPDHCRNILDPSFRNVGTGVSYAAVGTWATQPSTWTQDFGLTMSQNPLSGNTGPQNGCPY